MAESIVEKTEYILEQLRKEENLSKYLASDLQAPQPYTGKGTIKLIVLGQDPTVKDAPARQMIKTVLNLDRKKSVWNYLVKICRGIGIDMNENVYATNLYKNFFTDPPAEIKEVDIFSIFLPYWLPLLEDELIQFPNIPIITLGEPVMQILLKANIKNRVREYWGFTPEWKAGKFGSFDYIKAEDNLLGRTLFPFPHQPSLRKEFYKLKMNDYIEFVKKVSFVA